MVLAAEQRLSLGLVHGDLPGQIDGADSPRTVTLSVLDGGLVLAEDGEDKAYAASVPRAYPWTEVAHVWFANDVEGHFTEDDTVITQWVYVQRLMFADGTVVTSRLADPPVVTPQTLFRTGALAEAPPSSIGPLLAHVRDRVTELQLARAKATLAAGGQVEFGPVTATADGLRHHATQVPWQDITSLRYSFVITSVDEAELGAFLRIEFRDPDAGDYGFPFQWLRIQALDVPDMEVLELLAAERRT